MNLKNQLTELLEKNQMSASRFSKEVKIPRSTIFDWLAGASPKNIAQVKKAADFFNVSIDYLCFCESKNNSGIEEYSEEINAGVFEVVLRRVKR